MEIKLQFKDNPQMSHKVIEESETHYKLLIGWVPKEQLEPLKDFTLPEDIEILIHLTNN